MIAGRSHASLWFRRCCKTFRNVVAHHTFGVRLQSHKTLAGDPVVTIRNKNVFNNFPYYRTHSRTIIKARITPLLWWGHGGRLCLPLLTGRSQYCIATSGAAFVCQWTSGPFSMSWKPSRVSESTIDSSTVIIILTIFYFLSTSLKVW